MKGLNMILKRICPEGRHGKARKYWLEKRLDRRRSKHRTKLRTRSFENRHLATHKKSGNVKRG
jgi:hypothetical protein